MKVILSLIAVLLCGAALIAGAAGDLAASRPGAPAPLAQPAAR